MNAPTTDLPMTNSHQEIEELLPWYASGALTATERLAVDQHLAQCPACQAELEQCRAIANQLHEQAEETWQPPANHFEQLMADIDRLTPPAADPVPAKARPNLWQRMMKGLQITPAPVRWTLAMESLAVAALVLVVLLPTSFPTDPGYETLSSSGIAVDGTEPRLRVVFDDQMRIGELRTLLRGVGGRVAAGPSPLGIYTIALSGDGPPKEVLDQAMTALRAHPQVQLVEPLVR